MRDDCRREIECHNIPSLGVILVFGVDLRFVLDNACEEGVWYARILRVLAHCVLGQTEQGLDIDVVVLFSGASGPYARATLRIDSDRREKSLRARVFKLPVEMRNHIGQGSEFMKPGNSWFVEFQRAGIIQSDVVDLYEGQLLLEAVLKRHIVSGLLHLLEAADLAEGCAAGVHEFRKNVVIYLSGVG